MTTLSGEIRGEEAPIKNRRVVAAMLVVGLVASSCSSNPDSVDPPEMAKVRVLVAPFLGFLPFYIGDAEGYYTEQNLEVELVPIESPNAALPAFIQGEGDVWAGSLGPNLFNAINQGGRIQIVADKGYIDPNGCPYWALVARSDLNGDNGDLGLLENATVGVSTRPSISTSYFLDTLTDIGNVPDESLDLHALPNPSVAEALGDGLLDFTTATEPWITRILDAGSGEIWYTANEALPDYQIGYTVFNSRFLDEEPDVGERFMIAYLNAMRQYNEGKTEQNLDNASEATGLDRDFLERACWSAMRDDGSINTEAIDAAQEWAVSQDMNDRVLSSDEYWNSSFVDHANAVLAESG
jgi:NitT/TauT family transport system substrate-binding protein